MPRYGLLLAAIGIAIFPLQTHAACYHVDGSRTDSTFEPCDPDAEVSACCATNKRLPDVCLSSGLCYSQEPGFNGLMYSNGCTDPTGEDEACPHFCPDRTNDWDGGSKVAAWNVLQCNAGNRFCCRSSSDTDNCCDNSTAAVKFDIGTLKLPTKTATVSVSGTAAATISGEPASTQSGSSGPAECPKDNTAIVGGAVGGGLGAALLASLGVIAVLWRRRKTDEDARLSVQAVGQDTSSPPHYEGYKQPSGSIQELDARPARSELQGYLDGK